MANQVEVKKITTLDILKHFFLKVYAENNPKHKAVHTVYSSMNEVLRKTGEATKDYPVKVQKGWEEQGLVTVRTTKGGAQLFLTEKGHKELGIRPPSFIKEYSGGNKKVDNIISDIKRDVVKD